VQEIKDILSLLLEISFETSIDLISNSKLLIRQHQFLKIYLATLAFLSKYAEWTEVVVVQCKSFIDNIKGSYYNYSICSQVILYLTIVAHIQ